MKLINGVCVLSLIVSLGAMTTAYAQSSDPTPTANAALGATADKKSARKADRKLSTDVRRALSKTKGIDVTNIFVRARSGAITLTGSVPESVQIGEAETVARGVLGVTSVANKLSMQAQNY